MAGSAAGAAKVKAARLGMAVEQYLARVASGEKWCRACSEWHPRAAFGVDRSRPDGLVPVCMAARGTATGTRPTSRERRQKREAGLAWCRGCEHWLPVTEVRQGACRPHLAAEYRAHYAANPEPTRQRVYARKRDLDPIPAWWLEERRELFGGLCAYGCGRPGATVDHVWPVARGGRSVPGNLVPACASCNASKKDRDPRPWVDRGWLAFPWEWLEVADLADLHGTDEWMSEAS